MQCHKISIELYDSYVEKNLLNKKVDDTSCRILYDYSRTAMFDKVWDEITLNSRGLVVDFEGNIIARPFPKFFNYEELQESEIPNLPYEVFKKEDGSLGIAYIHNEELYVHTRGSFNSEQGNKAKEILLLKYPNAILKEGYTYLFEIIYPENRIVIDYGNMEELILLAVIETKTGIEIQHSELNNILHGIPVIQKCDVSTFLELKEKNFKNEEGYVIRFSNGMRMKIKFEDYVRLHSILSNISTYSVYEQLSNGLDVKDILSTVPDEVDNWIRDVVSKLQFQYTQLEIQVLKMFELVKHIEDKKEYALTVLKTPYHVPLFNLKQGRGYESWIWKQIKPEYAKFSNDDVL